jgi:hypothetical protein
MLAAAALMFGQTTPPQTTLQAARKGPRAVALLELANGKARLIPITVMSDGKFYDAGSYKASPVPMALQRDTVYEAVRTGVSQGLFTVIDAFHRGNQWVADGKWQPAGAAPPKKRPAEPIAPRDDDQDKPPVLRRPPAESRPGVGSETPNTETPSAPAANPPVATQPVSAGADDSPPDKDRPVLRRGKQPSVGPEEEPKTGGSSTAPGPAPAGTAAKAEKEKTVDAKAGPVLIPAVSDAGGSDPRPYSYTIKSAEEQQLRKKMMAMASIEIRERARQLASERIETAPARTASQKIKAPAIKTGVPGFEDTQFRILDLSTSNEPVLVLTSNARLPAGPRINSGGDIQYHVALVAREDVSGELHKAFSSVTDSRHLDILPRLELIDAVDADGDGRGELLFREISDTGRAFVIYRVIGDQLWALFQGTPE